MWLSASSDRSNVWLTEQLDFIWESRFQDTPRVNDVEIYFARPWKTRLGVITLAGSEQHTFIRINSLLREPQVPVEVCLVTMAHELVHYAHGFGSSLPRRYAYPHQGNIVTHELLRRGFSREFQFYKDWITEHWYPFYYSQIGHRRGRGYRCEGRHQPYARSAACAAT